LSGRARSADGSSTGIIPSQPTMTEIVYNISTMYSMKIGDSGGTGDITNYKTIP
jgi:hypothetical protein